MTLELGYFASIVIGTFILEDAALAAAIGLVAADKLGFEMAFLACFFGIAVGDLGLYFIGTIVSRFGLENRFQAFKKLRASSALMTYSIVLSRIIPGTRLPTYLAAGFVNYNFTKFLLLTLVTVFAWVMVAMISGQALQEVLAGNWLLTVLIFLMVVSLLRSIGPKLVDPWQRRALRHSWRRWMHFEFWPAWLFYLPIVPLYIYRSLLGRSFLLPFYANPRIYNGGLIGESKWDFLKHLQHDDPSTLKSICIYRGSSFEDSKKLILESAFHFPFILKPDVGQRGYGVRIVRSEAELNEYLRESQGQSIIAQTLSQYRREAGIFYFRQPGEDKGMIFSITDKIFPFVVGDGVRPLGDLILLDIRARIIAPVYFARHRERLDEILPKDFCFLLSECGNHCQGAIFKNGQALLSPELSERIELIARTIPDFYFGRFDLRYQDQELLRQGLAFEIVEVNGAGSEATHIWDSQTTILEAYRVLFKQWSVLFSIGAAIKSQKLPYSRVFIWAFVIDFLRVIRRDEKLSVSS